MSRRRSTNPTKAISITLPESLLHDIHDQLTRTTSRSNWIADACRQKIGDYSAGDMDTRRLMAMLHARINSPVLKTLLLEHLTSSSPSEEP